MLGASWVGGCESPSSSGVEPALVGRRAGGLHARPIEPSTSAESPIGFFRRDRRCRSWAST